MNSFIIPTDPELMGGLLFFKYVPSRQINTIQVPVNGVVQVTISLVSGASWGNGYSSRGELQFECDASTDQGRKIFDVSVKGFYPGLSAEMTTLFAQMVTDRFVVVAPDFKNQNSLFGSKKDGLRFRFSEKSGKKASERPGYEFEFFGKVRTERLKYSAEVLLPPAPGSGSGGSDY